MPKLYEYLGILLVLRSDDHEPIHFHAFHNGNEVAVLLYVKNGIVHTVRYQERKGKFSPAKMRDLKEFVSKHKNVLLLAYTQSNLGVRFKTVKITKRIK